MLLRTAHCLLAISFLVGSVVSWSIADAGEFLLVSGAVSDNVVRFDAATGDLIDVFVPTASGGLDFPEQLGITPNGELLVNSWGSNQVLTYDAISGSFLGEFASLNRPTGLVFRENAAFISSFSGAFVDEYDATTGAFLGQFVTPGSGGLGLAHGLTFGPDDNLYVSDNEFDRVLRFDGTTGAFIDVFVSAGSGGLDNPTGLTFGPDNNLYVSSDFSDEVLRYDGVTGTFIDDFVSAASGGLSNPHGLIFRDDGLLYVAGGNVLRFDATTGAFFDVFASSVELDFPTYMAFVIPEPSGIMLSFIGLLALAGTRSRSRVS